MKYIGKRHFLALATICSLATGTAAEARRPAASPFMSFGGEADAPAGFTEMCARDARLCTTRIASPAQSLGQAPTPSLMQAVAFEMMPVPRMDDRATFQMIRSVNSRVNRQIVPITDIAATGSYDRWERPSAARGYVGDCEDYAIEKRARLIALGMDESRMFYAVAYKRGYGLHTVLVVRMDAGDYVLDSLSPHVLNWSQVRYSWVRRQSTENPMLWTRIDTESTIATVTEKGPKRPA